MLEIVTSAGQPRSERAFLGKTRDGHLVEWAETWSASHDGAGGWMISLSPSLGCPVSCAFCDAGRFYKGKLDATEILEQLDHVLGLPPGDGPSPARLWLEFSKVGEPSFNQAVLEVLRLVPQRYPTRGVAPIVSTVAPERTDAFFEELLAVRPLYGPREFQLRYSLHTSDEAARKRLVPIKTWSFERIAAYGARFHRPGDRKVALRFAVSPSFALAPSQLAPVFSPDVFSIELTALNCTDATREAQLDCRADKAEGVAAALRGVGFEVVHCPINPAADALRTSCGMSVAAKLDAPFPPRRWLAKQRDR